MSSPFIVQASSSGKWARKAIAQLVAQRRGYTFDMPVNMAALIYRDRATGDLTNYLNAIADVLQAAEVVTNDRLIVRLDGTRLLKDTAKPRVEITITELHAAQGKLFT